MMAATATTAVVVTLLDGLFWFGQWELYFGNNEVLRWLLLRCWAALLLFRFGSCLLMSLGYWTILLLLLMLGGSCLIVVLVLLLLLVLTCSLLGLFSIFANKVSTGEYR
jgi:cellulose synthase/poly-beta-1,6-N-acetylglucosamine synthase-like glycosyltransferase